MSNVAYRILWVDNDIGYINTFTDNLKSEGHQVEQARFVSLAENLLSSSSFNLLILDAMIPVLEEEELDYPPEETDLTHKTGLLFYRKWKDRLAQVGTIVLVMTVRVDEEIAREFEALGLPAGNFATKHELRRWDDFRAKVGVLLSGVAPESGAKDILEPGG